MTFLQSLARVVTRYGKKKLDIVHFDLEDSGKENIYEKGLRLSLGDIPPIDKEGKNYLGYIKGSDASRQYEGRLGKRLLNMLLLTDLSEIKMSVSLRTELDSLRNAVGAKLLTSLYERDAGVELAKKVLRASEEQWLAEPALMSLKILRANAAETGEKEEHEILLAKSAKWMDCLAAEDRARGYFEQMELHFAKSISQKPWLAKEAFAFAELIEKDLERYNSPTLYYEKQRLMFVGHHCAKKYQEAVVVLDILKNWLQGHEDFAGDTKHGETALHKLDCYVHLGDHEAGRKCADDCLKYFGHGSTNRLYFMELYFLFAMQTGEYLKACNIIADAKTDPRFEGLANIHKEKWQLYKDYNDYANAVWNKAKNFSTIKFLNNYQLLVKDKSGHNAAIYIIAWCMQVRYGDTVATTGSAAALKQYRNRHLGEEQDHRLNIFMNMMQIADRLDYNYEKVQKATAEILTELKATPVAEYTGNLEGVEIIPLETLWEMVMKDMKSRMGDYNKSKQASFLA